MVANMEDEEKPVPTDEATPKEEMGRAEKPKHHASYKLKLRTADGTLLARCPTKKAGLSTANAIYDGLEVFPMGDGTWELRSGGVLRATVGR